MDDREILASFHAYEQADIDLYAHAGETFSALNAVMNMLREKDKYGMEYKSVEEAIEKIRKEALGIMAGYHLPRD